MSDKKSEVEILHQGRFIRMVRRDGWEYVEHHTMRGVAVLVAVTDDGRLLLVEQFRKPLQERVIELPAGMVGDRPGEGGESFEEAARRELKEETGYLATHIRPLTAGPYSPARSSALYTFFRASGLTKVGPGGGDEHEDITVHEIALSEVDTWLRGQAEAGRLIDPKIYAGLYFIRTEAGG